jgi:murein DD-endopeptidase MepM/ murein hydrolase activator NlpD
MRALFSAIVLAVMSMAPAARATEPGLLQTLADELLSAGQRVAGTDAVPFTSEARTARIEMLWPQLSTILAEVRSAAIESVDGVVDPGLAERLLTRGPLDLELAPGVAFNLQTIEDVARLQAISPEWSRAAAVASAADAFDVGDFRACPIKGVHWFENTWGAPRGAGRTHKGTDMMSLHGMKLYAMESGQIIQMNWHWAGGRTLFLLGETSGDVYYYAHLDGYAPTIDLGSRVEVGDHLGWVGYTGNADSPHLHLGWMPGAGAVDFDGLENPYLLLADLCR